MKKFAVIALFTFSVSAADLATNAPAPNCELSDLKSGQSFDLSRFKGKVVYLDFWASWCTSCLQSFPFMNAMHKDLQHKGLEVIAVNLDEDRQLAVDFLARKTAHFMIARDEQQACPAQFSVQGMPTSYLIDKSGKLVRTHVGYQPADAETLRKEVESLL